jgi:hypothetical protein
VRAAICRAVSIIVARERRVHPAADAGDDRELRAERRHVIALLRAECIGGHDAQRVAARGADEREGNAGAAAGVFDDAAARLEAPRSLRRRDHGQGHAVFHAPGRIGAFDLDQNPRAALRDDAPEREQRRAADALQDGGVDR